MATAGDQINAALRLLGVIAEGETPSSEMTADGLSALNQMLESWSLSGLKVYAMQTQAITWPSGQQTRTVGLTGQIVANSPITVMEDTYYTVGNQSFPLHIISGAEFNAIPQKNNTSTHPEYLSIDYTVPNATLSLYPIPSNNLAINLVSPVELQQPALASTDLVVPKGYLRAIKYNLAIEIAPEFSIEPSPTVVRNAIQSMKVITRTNKRKEDGLMDLPIVFIGSRSSILEG